MVTSFEYGAEMAIKKLLFVDTNIWLDFYRARNEISLELLRELEKVQDEVIVTYQLESEFKKNRQIAILEGMKNLTPPGQIARLGIFSDAKAAEKVNQGIKEIEQNIKLLRKRLHGALIDPGVNDPVYKTCQRIFHKVDDLTLTHKMKQRHTIRRLAFRRFLHGCPPRKSNDTSIGDAINWEWMVQCAQVHKAELVIVSRDADYGVTVENKSYINDHLRQEFSERVSRKRHVLLHAKLSEALKHFKVPVSAEATKAESLLIEERSRLGAVGEHRQWDESTKRRVWEQLMKFSAENLAPPEAER